MSETCRTPHLERANLKPYIVACVAVLLALGMLLGCAQSYLGGSLQRPLVMPTLPAAALGPARSTQSLSSAKAVPYVANGLYVPERFRGTIINRRLPLAGQKVVALTFDDGPDPKITPQILGILRQYQAKASFFVIGRWALRYPDLVRDVLQEGHAVGSHSYNHPFRVDPDAAALDLEEAAAVIERITGNRTQFFRPPWGNLSSNLCQSAINSGYAIVRWTVCGNDNPLATTEKIVSSATSRVQSGDIILLHDGHNHEGTAQALPIIMKRLTAAGYKFVTVPQLLARAENSQEAGIVELYAAP